MKSEKGITLVSLIVYVIAMLITVTIITVVTSYFYKNIDVTGEEYDYIGEFTRFESYFSAETNTSGNTATISPALANQATAKQSYIKFSKGNQYTYVKANKAVYQNKVKIASNVESCTFQQTTTNGKKVITVTMKIKDKERTMKYTLK